MEQEKKETLNAKELVREALNDCVTFFRDYEKILMQDKNPKFAKKIGFLKLALKKLEELKE